MLDRIVPEAARRFGDHPALLAADGTPVSYVELDRRSDAVAVGVARRGIGPGSVVALTLPSTPAYVVAYLALAKVGALTAGVNPRLTDAERSAALEVVGPDLVLAGAEEVAALAVAGEAPPPLPPDPERPVAVVLTSGTTGRPAAPSSGSASSRPSPPPTWARPGAAGGRCWPPPSSPTSGS